MTGAARNAILIRGFVDVAVAAQREQTRAGILKVAGAELRKLGLKCIATGHERCPAVDGGADGEVAIYGIPYLLPVNPIARYKPAVDENMLVPSS